MEERDEPPLTVEEDGPELADLDRVVDNIRTLDPRWNPGEPKSFGGLRWRPDLKRDDVTALLHVHLAERLRPHVLERISAATDNGYEVHIALPLLRLYDEELLRSLIEFDPQIHVIRGTDMGVAEPDALLNVVCDRRVRVGAEARRNLAVQGFELSQAEVSSQLRGRRYEALISFLLSQISDFDVVERNLRTEAEELDAVVQQRATQGRVWATLGAPFVLVEAKNWNEPVPQKEVSAFRIKMDGRRGAVRLGLMFGTSGFTSDALIQELRFASDELTIAFVGPDELLGWMRADDADEYLETLIRRAMLR